MATPMDTDPPPPPALKVWVMSMNKYVTTDEIVRGLKKIEEEERRKKCLNKPTRDECISLTSMPLMDDFLATLPPSKMSSSQRQDNTRRRMEQNRAAQRAFRERRDRRVAELTARAQELEQALERANSLVPNNMRSPLEDELGKTAQDSRDVVKPDLRRTRPVAHLGSTLGPYGWLGSASPPEANYLLQDPDDGSIPPHSDYVPLKRDLPMPELSYSQPQAPMITPVITPAGRSALEFALGLKAFNDTSPSSLNDSRPDPHANSEASWLDDYQTAWTTSSLPTSHLKVTSTFTRSRTTNRNQHHQYMDSLLRSKCPKSRIHALNMAIQFRNERGANEPIPNNLLDELLEPTGDGKYIFCCQRGQKPRNKTGARDHVRKSLGNLPFRCSNLGCGHSSLRQADRNKHMKICKFPTATFSPNVGWGVPNLEFPAPDLSASASLTLQEQNTVVDADPLLDITNTGEDIMDSYLAFPLLGGEYDAGIDGAE